MYYDVVAVQVVKHLHLRVTFRDGLSGDVTFIVNHLRGVFKKLKDPEIFFSVNCTNGFVEWPGEIDLAPDVMYENISKNGVWEIS